MDYKRKSELFEKALNCIADNSCSSTGLYDTLSGVLGMTDAEILEEGFSSLADYMNNDKDIRISAVIEYKGNTLILPLPASPMDICEKLSSIGMSEYLALSLRARDSKIASVELVTENSIGYNLVKLFDNAQLSDISVILMSIINSPAEIWPELSKRIISDFYTCVKDLLDDITLFTNRFGRYTSVFCFPLLGNLIYDNEEDVVSNRFLMNFKNEIQELLDKEQQDDDLTQYFDDDEAAQKKVVSIRWDILELKGKLYGKVVFRLREPFTDREKEIAREWVEGQNSDGFGEGFEQRKIETEDGDLYVSLWFNTGDYFVYDEMQMSEYVQYGGLLT